MAVVRVDGAGVGVSRPWLCVRGGLARGSEILGFEPGEGEEMESLAACLVLDQVRLRRDFLRLRFSDGLGAWL